MAILGLSGLAHHPAAALLGEHNIEAAIEESKLARGRDLSGIPREAIRFSMERTGTVWKDVSHIAVASRPLHRWMRHAWFRLKTFPVAPVACAYYESKALGELGREMNNFRLLRELPQNATTRVVGLDHHLCHAASAFFASPFDRAAILTLDREGDGLSGLLAVGEGNRIRVLKAIRFPHSLGCFYSQITEILGFKSQQDEHKAQWLSLESDPAYLDLFMEMLGGSKRVVPRLQSKFFERGFARHVSFSAEFYRRLGLSSKRAEPLGDDVRRQLAASVQRACEVAATRLAQGLRQETGANVLCLAGGVFLNGLVVAHLENAAGFEQVFVQPVAGNEGTALGSAWLLRHHLLGLPRAEPMRHLYLGPCFSNTEIKRVVDNCKTRSRFFNTEEAGMEETISLLEAGRIVAWFHGAAEFGPRALGNRSLLASPWAPYVKENLNEFVKHRESFRPFALAVPEEDAPQYFQSTPANHFMASIALVKPAAGALLEGFVLPGRRVRLHVVQRSTNPLLWQLLRKFGARAPAPLLVNTSFNLFGEPLVITPRDAVRSYACSGIDALVIGSFLMSKS